MKASRSKDFSIASILGDRVGCPPPTRTNLPRHTEIERSSTTVKEEPRYQCNCDLRLETVYNGCCERLQERQEPNERFEKCSQDVRRYLGQSTYAGPNNGYTQVVSQNPSKCLPTLHKADKFRAIGAIVAGTTGNAITKDPPIFWKTSNDIDEEAVKEKQKIKDATILDPHIRPSISVSSTSTREEMCENLIGRLPDSIASESGGSCTPNLKANTRNLDREVKHTEESTERRLSLSPTEKLDWLEYTRYRPPKIPRKVVLGRHKRRRPSVYPRIPFSSVQLEFLEEKFRTSVYLTKNEVTEIASSLRLPHSRVKIWFQNRRARARREKQSLDEPS